MPAGVPLAALADHPQVRAWAQRWIVALAATGTGSSNRVARAMLMTEPPSAALGELTNKGSLNQRTIVRLRGGLVDALYAEDRRDERVLRAS